MFVEILIALSCLLIQPTTHHFIGNFDECTASKVCNHTWNPVCGHREQEASYRLFLDDCDLHEYNCDNNTTYVEVDIKVCSTKCTQHDQADIPTTPMPPTPPPSPKVSTIMTTEEIQIETTTITTAKEVIETIKDKTDTSTIFVASTTLEMATKQTTRKQTLEMTTERTATTTEATITTNVYASTDVTTVKPIIEITTATELPSTLNNKNNINDDENTIPEETTFSTSVATLAKFKLNCNPNSCSMPSTWETTSVGETRDLVQILRERYGNRITFLRDTTHFPKQPTYARKSAAFITDYHRERQKEQYYVNKLDTW